KSGSETQPLSGPTPAIGRVRMSVDGAGQVFLSGVVASDDIRLMIERDARSTPGVTRVFSELRVADAGGGQPPPLPRAASPGNPQTPPPPPSPVLPTPPPPRSPTSSRSPTPPIPKDDQPDEPNLAGVEAKYDKFDDFTTIRLDLGEFS